MRVRLVSSLLFLQNFLPLAVEGKVMEDSCSDGIQLCVSKQPGDSGLLLIPISNLHPRGFAVSSIIPETSASASLHFQGMVSFLCQCPGSRPTSFTDVRVSGAVGRLSSDQKARQPSSLSRVLLSN